MAAPSDADLFRPPDPVSVLDAEIALAEQRLRQLKRERRPRIAGRASGEARLDRERNAKIVAAVQAAAGEAGATLRVAQAWGLTRRQVQRILKAAADPEASTLAGPARASRGSGPARDGGPAQAAVVEALEDLAAAIRGIEHEARKPGGDLFQRTDAVEALLARLRRLRARLKDAVERV